MPYIDPKIRPYFDEHIETIASDIHSDGELNYVLTRIVLRFLKRQGLNYRNLATIVGTLKLVSTELERRLIANYEDEKIAENGDVEEYRRTYFL